MARKYHQGTFVPKHPEKYVGDVSKIAYRSSWERKFMGWADSNPNVVYWQSEEVIIPYMSPVDHKPHRYFVDFTIRVRDKNGNLKNYLVEIKPKAQTLPPTARKKTKRYLEEVATYMVNQAKWEQADAWANKRGMQFVVLTEEHLYK